MFYYWQDVGRINQCAHAHWNWVKIDERTHSGKYNPRSDKYNKTCELQCIPRMKNHAFVDRDDYLVSNFTVSASLRSKRVIRFTDICLCVNHKTK